MTGSSNWTVNVGLGGGRTVQSSWDANVSGTSGNLTVTPNGSGNSFRDHAVQQREHQPADSQLYGRRRWPRPHDHRPDVDRWW
ncbi:MAG: hypothetical protein U0Q15_19350 [Kineosporiaceae bacterium]